MLSLLLFPFLIAGADLPIVQFQQTSTGTRTATIRAACNSPQGAFTISSPVADVVEQNVVRFKQPVLSDTGEDKCIASCPEDSRLVTMQLAEGGMGEVKLGLACVELTPTKTKASRVGRPRTNP